MTAAEIPTITECEMILVMPVVAAKPNPDDYEVEFDSEAYIGGEVVGVKALYPNNEYGVDVFATDENGVAGRMVNAELDGQYDYFLKRAEKMFWEQEEEKQEAALENHWDRLCHEEWDAKVLAVNVFEEKSNDRD